jgi:hypothetical protein
MDSHDHGPMMSSYICIIILSKLIKKDRKDEGNIVQMRQEGWWMTHEDKMPKPTCDFPKIR